VASREVHTSRGDALSRNYFTWLSRWQPDVQRALDWACAQFPIDVQRRGIARGYYEFGRVLDEIVRACGGSVAGLKIADVGCGAGLLALALRKLGAEVTAIDRFVEYDDEFQNQMGSTAEIVSGLARHGVVVYRRDIVAEGLPLDGAAYDVVLFLAVIEHLRESPRPLLEAMHGMLRSGGIVVITTPNHAWLRTRLRLLFGRSANHPLHDWWRTPFFGHTREFTLDELTQMLQWTGFVVVRATISSWVHVASRRRGRKSQPDSWSTAFTLDSLERILVAGSFLLTAFFKRLRYSMLVIGRKPVSRI
jgi:2-polyprenyl-3-methyl-5-hydroxy-6-metoxy-1,4-benzoquinol methylase